MRRTIIVSNRLPVIVKKSEKGLEYFQGDGGLVSAMRSFTAKRGTIWIGWPGIESDNLTEKDKLDISRKLQTMNCVPVFLTKKQVSEFYSGYSNTILWPLFHHLKADFKKEKKYWQSYKQVNELFADVVVSISSPDSSIWIHDYQLMLLPEILRNNSSSERIGFFLHIPFPDVSHAKKLEHNKQLVNGLVGADLLGFHTTDYAEQFMNLCENLNIGTKSGDTIVLKTRAVQVTDFPIGIDYKKFSTSSKKRNVKKRVRALKRKYKKRKIIVTVDRLDPTKGFVQRLKAYQTFLKENPELYSKVVMVMLAIPSRGDVAAYIKLRKDVENLVSKINDQFGDKNWQPIDYMHKTVDSDELAALYSMANVAFVAPIKDGMNLVAKEYVASQHKKDGVLILSETAGAALELKQALLVNPRKPKTLVDALDKALKMPKKELRKNIHHMQETIAKNTNKNWADSFMKTLYSTDKLLHTVNLSRLRAASILANYETASKRLLIFDYDGVLSPFVDNPADAKPSKKVMNILEKLSKDPLNDVAIISGRSKNDLESWLGKLPIDFGAEHGSVTKINGKWQTANNESNDWKAILKPLLEKQASQSPGSFVEVKQNSLVWHYRAAKPYYAQKSIATIKTNLKPIIKSFGIKMYMGNKILEFKHQDINKGIAAKTLLTRKFYDFILVMGDDYTDEDMFKAVPKKAFTIKVGPGRTAARFRILNQSRVLSFIKNL